MLAISWRHYWLGLAGSAFDIIPLSGQCKISAEGEGTCWHQSVASLFGWPIVIPKSSLAH